jgi:hypothetical protein
MSGLGGKLEIQYQTTACVNAECSSETKMAKETESLGDLAALQVSMWHSRQ